MSNAVVFERRNKQIQDALDSGNLKQALQHCEKHPRTVSRRPPCNGLGRARPVVRVPAGRRRIQGGITISMGKGRKGETTRPRHPSKMVYERYGRWRLEDCPEGRNELAVQF
ncbi:hypothetical protein KEM55_006161 [Ascosphaera atra]|nr:hypothetical protein KEM55_006161 [Ascosphaera atra]